MQRTRPVWGAFLASLALFWSSSGQSAETYAYDALGRLIVVVAEDGKRWTYAYDDPGNRTQSAGVVGSLQAPQAIDDPKSYSYGSGPLIFDPRVNDVDPAGLPMTVIGVAPPQFGTATFNTSSVTYTAPTTNVSATDVFAYTIQNSAGLVSSAFVSVALSNAQPIANPDNVSTVQNQPVTFDPRVNDVDPGGNTLSVTSITTPSHGSASFTSASVTFAPATGYVGPDSFGYSIANGVGGTASSTISVTVTPSGAPLSVALSSIGWNWSRISTGPITRSPPLAVTAAGGIPPYSYSWQYVSGDTQISVIPQTGGASAVWNRTISTYGTWTAVWRVVVTDAADNSVTSPNINVRFIWDSGA